MSSFVPSVESGSSLLDPSNRASPCPSPPHDTYEPQQVSLDALRGVMMLGGVVVTVIGLDRVGGLGSLMQAAPEKFKMIYPLSDKDWPWFGVWSIEVSIGIWYNCTNQFIVQRCLGARSEWDARMGVVFAGFMKILLPLLVVILVVAAVLTALDLVEHGIPAYPEYVITSTARPAGIREAPPMARLFHHAFHSTLSAPPRLWHYCAASRT